MNALASHHHVARLAEVAVVVVDVDHRLGLVVLPSKTFKEVVVFIHLLAWEAVSQSLWHLVVVVHAGLCHVPRVFCLAVDHLVIGCFILISFEIRLIWRQSVLDLTCWAFGTYLFALLRKWDHGWRFAIHWDNPPMPLRVFFMNDVLFIEQVASILTQVSAVFCPLWLREYALVVLTHLFFYATLWTWYQVSVRNVRLCLHPFFEGVVVGFPRIAAQNQLVVRLFDSVVACFLKVDLIHRDLCRAFLWFFDGTIVKTASVLQLGIFIWLSDDLPVIWLFLSCWPRLCAHEVILHAVLLLLLLLQLDYSILDLQLVLWHDLVLLGVHDSGVDVRIRHLGLLVVLHAALLVLDEVL